MAILFDEAKKVEGFRQEYLNSFLLSHPSDNVSELRYNLHKKAGLERVSELEFGNSIDKDTANRLRSVVYNSQQFAFLLLTPDMIGKGDRHPIIVNPRAFEELSEEAFRYNIEDHEYFHSMDFRFGIPLPNGVIVNHTNAEQLQKETLEGLVDTRALIHQLIRGKELGLAHTEAFMNVIHGFLKYHNQLKGITPLNIFEKAVITAQLSSYQGMLPEHLREKKGANQ